MAEATPIPVRQHSRETRFASVDVDRSQAGNSLSVPDAAVLAAAAHIRDAAPGLAQFSVNDVNEQLDAVLQLIHGSNECRDPEPDPASLALQDRLLGLLRAEVIAEWSRSAPPPESARIIAILQRFDSAEKLLNKSWCNDPSKRLIEPAGLELLLEVAHDLRSPLTSIMFLAETMLSGGSGPITDVQRTQLGIVYSAALGLTGVASDVIEFAKRGSQLKGAPTLFCIDELLQSIRNIVLPMAEQKGVDIQIESSVADLRAGYSVPLSRVLLNLATNALKFTENGHVAISATAINEQMVEFSVRDTGPGIPHEVRTTLFEPFRRRLGRNGYHFSGTGLGLSICRKLVQVMEGELNFETHAHSGTRFWFRLSMPPVNNPL